MTIYISKKEMKEAIKRVKASGSPNQKIVKGGYNIIDNDGYLVSEVRVLEEKKEKNKKIYKKEVNL